MHPLYIVATPIGNLEDITLRALRILKEVRVIFCESPARTRKLLAHYQIAGKILVKYTEHQERRLIPRALEVLQKEPAALVSDAGTPAISDPGARLVEAVLQNGGKAIPVPGPSALSAALSVSGLVGADFIFVGFLPRKKGKLLKFLRFGRDIALPIVGYESPYRIMKTLEVIRVNAPEVFLVLTRELTKIHEEIIRGSPQEILNILKSHPEKIRGEFVVIALPAA